jgi:hypothetical protein
MSLMNYNFAFSHSNDQYYDGFWSDFRAAAAAVNLLIIKPLHNT